MFAQQPFQNGQAARAVIGQFTFTKGDQNPTGQVLGGASGVAWAGNRLFVADSNRLGATPNDSRVLVFDTTLIPGLHTDITQDTAVQALTSCYVCGFPASFSLGQDTFTPPTYVPSGQTTPVTGFYNGVDGGEDQPSSSPTENAWLYNADAVASDGVRLAVADTDNNRVLLWNSIPTGNQHPDLVVGQPNFSTLQTQQLGVVTATAMRGPQGVWIANNKLYVADTQNYRVLIWNSWPTKNNQPPDVVLGQPDFTHANAPPPTTTAPTAAANQLLNPTSVTADGGHVFVSDLGFNRVLIWNTTSPTIDQNADVVIGQPDFVQTTPNNPNICVTTPGGTTALPLGIQNQCQTSLNFPRFALSDGTRLFVADGGNDRVLIFNTIPTTNGAFASGVLGQTNFTNDIVTSVSISIVSTEVDNTGGVDTTPTPTSLAWDGTNLYVADPYNRRVLMFSAGDELIPSAFDTTATVIPVVNWAAEIVRQEGIVTFSLTPGGKYTSGDTATITIAGVVYSYTEKSSDNADTIAKQLVAKINQSDQNVTASFGGAGTGTVYLSSIDKSGAEAVSLGYDTISLAAAASNTANVTATASGQYLSAGNAATASPGALVEVNAPGGITFTDVDSTYIAPLNSSTNGGNVPNTANGVQLYFDGFASPLYQVSPTKLVGQIPWFYGDRNSTSVYVRTVRSNGTVTVTNATPVYIAPANPGIFDAQQFPNQKRPWPISQARHQLNDPVAVVSVDGSPTANDIVEIYVNGIGYPYTVTAADVTSDTNTGNMGTVVAGLVSAINASDPLVTASPGGSFTRVVLTAKLDGFSGGNGIPVSVATGTVSAGVQNCTTTTSTATELLTPYGTTGSDASCHATVNTCCAVRNGSPIFPANPAVPGELISIAVAGMGDIQNASGSDITNSITTGFPYSGPAAPNNDVLSANFAAATIGGVSAQVIFTGLDTGSYGIYRADLLLPTSLTANSQTPLYIAQNAFISNTVNIPVGNAVANPPTPPPPVPPSPINVSIDTPVTPSQIDLVTTILGSVQVAGWAVDSAAPITSVAVQIDGLTVATLTNGNGGYGMSRPDVCATYPGVYSCPNVGYSYMLDTTAFANGAHTLNVVASDGVRNYANPLGTVPIFINNDPNASHTHVNIDTPATSLQIYHGVVMFSGWATNDTSHITSFKAFIDGTLVDSTKIVYGISRPDVCAAAGTVNPPPPDCPNVGWNYLADLTALPNSSESIGSTVPHVFSITAIASNGQLYTVSSSFYVNNYDPIDLFSGPTVVMDTPSPSAGSLSGTTTLFGWAIDQFGPINSVDVSVDGVSYGSVPYGYGRPDVCVAYQNIIQVYNCPYVGFNGTLDTTLIADGLHTLGITANPSQGQPYTITRQISVGNLDTTANPVRITIDSPAEISSSLTTFSGIASVSGWTLTNNSTTILPNGVTVSVDGTPITPNGTATYGTPRPDVCATYSSTSCPNVGFTYSLDTTVLTNGTHVLEITSKSSGGQRATASASFNVANSSTSAQTAIDTPNAGSIAYSGIVTTSGWAIKNGVAISSVTVTVDGIPTGTATYGLSRPDVCATYPGRPGCPNVGWTFSFDTDALIDGTHLLGVTAHAADGTANTVTVSFTVSNWVSVTPPTAVIDTPSAGEPYYTGTVTFQGWVALPNVAITNVAITIDGVPFGPPATAASRPDVCASYSSPSCPNVGWTFSLNTSLLTNDVHTLGVIATTADGQNVTLSQTFTAEN